MEIHSFLYNIYHIVIFLQHAKCNDRTVISLSTRIKFPKTGALITFENSDFHWSLSRWKQLKHAMVVFHFLTRNTRDTNEIFVSAARRKNDSTPLFFWGMKYLLSGCTCSLELTKFTTFINKTYEEKRIQIRPEKSFFTTNYYAFWALKHIKLKSVVSYLCSLADVTKGLKLCVQKKSMYISRQFLNSFDISVFTNLAWRNKFYLILSVFCYFF